MTDAGLTGDCDPIIDMQKEEPLRLTALLTRFLVPSQAGSVLIRRGSRGERILIDRRASPRTLFGHSLSTDRGAPSFKKRSAGDAEIIE
jgi:hypothetical protein